MNTDTIKRIFQSQFDYTTYCNEIAHNIFGCNDIATSPVQLPSSSDGDQNYFIGRMTDADKRDLGFFYTRVAEGSDVRRKRVGLRKLIAPYLKYEVDAAIAVFDDGNHWRLSYICDMKEGVTAAKRFSYILGDPQGQYKTPIERLSDLGTQAASLRLCDIRDAFSVDALSKEFFDEYHRHYDIIVKELERQGNSGALYHDYVKKMLGRIVFLHFLQKKGWLDGNQAFLRDLFFMQPLDRRADFLEKVLEPLFFGIFNTEPQNREKVFSEHNWDLSLLNEWNGGSTNALTHSHNYALPYLNGGLFEEDAVDKLHIKLPGSLFEDLFTFLASYNFTVDENDPDDAEVGVDPEMLGKIFESLLEDNKAKGAFYTPKEIVRYMCKESLIAYLSSCVSKSPCPAGRNLVNLVDSADASNCERSKANNNLQDSQDFASETSRSIRRFVEHHEFPSELEPYRDTLDSALRNVKICDPAIGSGAFPMGLLNELWRCREALAIRKANNLQDLQDFVSAASRSKLKKEIIENNIYGVDIERGAIDIARLRFWLSIVVDAEEPEPLPNFDYKFMQGNSLIESYKGIDLSRISNRLRGGQSKSTQLLLGLDSDFSKKNLQRLMRDYFSVTDHKQKASMRQAINDEVKRLITDFIGGTSSDLDKLDPSANQDFFLWHTWFKDIFDNGGFDIVIGNPPYISAPTQIANEMLAKQRENIVRSKKYKTLYQKWDLYIPFIELGLHFNATNGITTMIVPFPLTNQLYAKVLRKMLVEEYDIYELVDLNGTKIFENATVSNCIPFIRKANSRGNTWISNICEDLVIRRSFQQSHEDLIQDKKTYVWNVTQEKRETNRHPKMHVLGDYCYISKGMVLNSDENETVEVFRKADLISDKKDNVHCRKFIEGKDCGKYVANRIRYLEYYTERVPDKCSRPTFRELYINPKLMFNRLGELQVFYDEYGDFTTSDAMFVCLLWKSLAKVNNKSISVSIKKFCSLPRYEMEKLSDTVDLRYLLGIMNSKYAAVLLTNLRGGDYHIYPEHIRNIPIPTPSQSQQISIISLVEQILSAKKDNPQSDTSSLEHEIDQLVYQLYNLTPEEIAIIEQ